jgi:hypothetical protein
VWRVPRLASSPDPGDRQGAATSRDGLIARGRNAARGRKAPQKPVRLHGKGDIHHHGE